MKAVGYKTPCAVNQPDAFENIVLPDPVATGRDLLVEVRAISVNPVDYKIRQSRTPPEGQWQVLGWDAAGVVRAVGPDVSLFKPGDAVWYAGDISRPGSNAELQLVDERIVSRKPESLEFAQAAALPLTTITAWEILFDRLGVVPGKKQTNESLLIIGAAGGVGSILTQLARCLTPLKIVGTASRPETRNWVKANGAHHIIDHNEQIPDQLRGIGLENVTYVASLNQTEAHFSQIAEAIAPQGKIALIDDLTAPLDVMKLKAKSVSLHWELMFTRSLFQTDDILSQHKLLDEVAALVDAGVIRTTLAEHFGVINAENLRRAHALLESGKSRGKIVLEGI